jgi:2-oxoglutarate dehydrogenase E2 component (dihydrolipoamide succinyltransferase)
MKKDIKIPSVGESITEVDISEWRVKSGDYVNRDDILLVLDSDKASLELAAEESGVVEIKTGAGETVPVGAVVGVIDTAAAKSASSAKAEKPVAAQVSHAVGATSAAVAEPERFSPAARKIAEEKGLSARDVDATGRGGRITKEDVLRGPSSAPVVTNGAKAPAAMPMELPKAKIQIGGERETRTKMPSIRRKIASRLVMAQHTAAILTTFNEIDMSAVMKVREQYKEGFEKKHGIKLGFMSFFTKAAVEAMKSYPLVNSYIDGDSIVTRHYYDISVAVSSPKGLVVPVVRDADHLSLADIEKSIKYYGQKAKDGTLSIEEMEGGGFTISNGGVFGSLLSTPILNPPQTGILGLHKIEDRAVVVNGQIVVRPMMYVALSYDHRIIDGAQSVAFLVKIKEMMEDPTRLLLEV